MTEKLELANRLTSRASLTSESAVKSKPGFLTSECWLSIVAGFGNVLLATEVPGIWGVLVAVLGNSLLAVSYTRGRTKVKAG